MQSVHRSVLVPFSAARMFALVDDIERYPEFLPWCGGAQVLETHAGGKTARLDIDYHGVRAHFTTDNANTPPASIVVTLKDGPFRHLHGEWRFTALAEDACKVEFVLAYEFTTHLLEKGRRPRVRPHREHLHRRVRPARRVAEPAGSVARPLPRTPRRRRAGDAPRPGSLSVARRAPHRCGRPDTTDATDARRRTGSPAAGTPGAALRARSPSPSPGRRPGRRTSCRCGCRSARPSAKHVTRAAWPAAWGFDAGPGDVRRPRSPGPARRGAARGRPGRHPAPLGGRPQGRPPPPRGDEAAAARRRGGSGGARVAPLPAARRMSDNAAMPPTHPHPPCLPPCPADPDADRRAAAPAPGVVGRAGARRRRGAVQRGRPRPGRRRAGGRRRGDGAGEGRRPFGAGRRAGPGEPARCRCWASGTSSAAAPRTPGSTAAASSSTCSSRSPA